jgi:DNA-binding HxlR family transcriptional regulator
MALPESEADPGAMRIEFLSCPVQVSLRVLGREWAFLVLTAIALFRANRYNEMLRAMPGLSKRLLSMRLGELEEAGFIHRAESRRGYVRWELTPKGEDVVPILLTLVRFGARWYADELFADRSPHRLEEIFDEGYLRRVLGIDPASPLAASAGTPRAPIRQSKRGSGPLARARNAMVRASVRDADAARNSPHPSR